MSPQPTHAAMSLALVSVAVLLLVLPSAASTLPGIPASIAPLPARRSLLQTGLACVTAKCAKQLLPCQADSNCLAGLICINGCLASKDPAVYFACLSKCIYTYAYGNAASAALNRCILDNKCGGSIFPKATCPAVKKPALKVTVLRGTYSVVRGGAPADRDPAKYTFAAKTITAQIRPTYLKPAKIIKYTSTLVSGNKYSGPIAGVNLDNVFYVLAATADKKFLVVGFCGTDTGAISTLVLSASAAQPSAAVSKVLSAGLAASGWGRYPYSKLVKVSTF